MVIITIFMDIKRDINKYFPNPLCCIFDNLYEMDQFLDRHRVPKLTQEVKDYITGLYLLKFLNQLPSKTEGT